MKRNNQGIPVTMVRRWARPPSSCQLCRAKKLRCDRAQTCSNCALRKTKCVYSQQSSYNKLPEDTQSSTSTPMREPQQEQSLYACPSRPLTQDRMLTTSLLSDAAEMTDRIRKLEKAVYGRLTEDRGSSTNNQSTSAAVAGQDHESLGMALFICGPHNHPRPLRIQNVLHIMNLLMLIKA